MVYSLCLVTCIKSTGRFIDILWFSNNKKYGHVKNALKKMLTHEDSDDRVHIISIGGHSEQGKKICVKVCLKFLYEKVSQSFDRSRFYNFHNLFFITSRQSFHS